MTPEQANQLAQASKDARDAHIWAKRNDAEIKAARQEATYAHTHAKAAAQSSAMVLAGLRALIGALSPEQAQSAQQAMTQAANDVEAQS